MIIRMGQRITAPGALDHDNLDFPQAVEELAKAAGTALPRWRPLLMRAWTKFIGVATATWPVKCVWSVLKRSWHLKLRAYRTMPVANGLARAPGGAMPQRVYNQCRGCFWS